MEELLEKDNRRTSREEASTTVILESQYAKMPLDKAWKVPTRLVVFMIALVVLPCAQGFMAGIAWTVVPLVLRNAVVVAIAAMGRYEVTFGRRVET